MIELHDNAGTKSYGCCRNMKEAQGILTYLKDSGKIPAREQSVTVCHYKNGCLVRTSHVEYRHGKWRLTAKDAPSVFPTAA